MRLMIASGADLLDGVLARKYHEYGSTHGLHDSFGMPVVVHTIDPLNVNAVLVSNFDAWKPSHSRTNTLYPLAQEGLLTTDGVTWQRNRKLIQRSLGGKNAKDIEPLEKDVQLLFEAIGCGDEDGWTAVVDLLPLFHRMALDMSTTYLLGASADSQAKGIIGKVQQTKEKRKIKKTSAESKPQAYTYDEAYEIVREYLSRRAKLGSKYWLADGFDYRAACAAITEFADDLVKRAIQQSTSTTDSKCSFGLIDSLKNELSSPVAIRNLTMDLLIAGQNMTGTLAAWVVAQLEANQDVYDQARDQVLQTFGTENEPTAPLTWSNLRSCNLLQWCILETLRLYPLLPNIGRNARHDTILPRGGGVDGNQPIAIPAGAAITANVYLMHRRPEEWGADAEEWKPSRWQGRKFGAEYAPFGAGPRICVGQQLTMTEVSYVLARMLQRFDAVKTMAGQDNLMKEYRVAVAPKHGVKVKLRIASHRRTA